MKDCTGREIKLGDRISRAERWSGGAYHCVGIVHYVSKTEVGFHTTEKNGLICKKSKLLAVLA